MIEKFNFYDVYGYFLPGLALIAVLWLPFGLVAHIWPKGDWSSALVAVALAYFVGHLMLYVSTNVFPSFDVKESTPGKERRLSATLLDSDSDLSEDFRRKIALVVWREFELELHAGDCAGTHDTVRNEAFILARQRLILGNVEGYAEQFQGMYSLARGLTVAFAVGAAYYLGWVLSTVRWFPMFDTALALSFVSLLISVNLSILILREQDRKKKQSFDNYLSLSILFVFFACGYVVAFRYDLGTRDLIVLSLCAAVVVVAAIRCYVQYRFFTVRFATTVWSDFTAYVLKNPKSERSAGNLDLSRVQQGQP